LAGEKAVGTESSL